MVVKTYRGMLADGGQEKIPLSTKDGGVGYRIVKFQVINRDVGGAYAESVVKIWKKSQATVDNIVNFSDSDLLAVAYYQDSTSVAETSSIDIIFDREIFNQDIFITSAEGAGSEPMNYYIELEQMNLDHTQNMSATLKAIRGSAVD